MNFHILFEKSENKVQILITWVLASWDAFIMEI